MVHDLKLILFDFNEQTSKYRVLDREIVFNGNFVLSASQEFNPIHCATNTLTIFLTIEY